MIFDTMKLGYDRHIILGEAPLTVTNSYKYLRILLQITCLMKQTWKIKKGVCTGDVKFTQNVPFLLR